MAKLIEIEQDVFSAYFDRRPFFVRHTLERHPLFAIERLCELAARLPPDFVEYNAGDLPVNQKGELTPRTGLSAEETVRRIAECGSWMVLKRVEQDVAYGALLDECLEAIRPLSERVAPEMAGRAGFIFLSSPGAVTPYHMDPEHNFLLQIRGSKTVNMWPPEDRFVISEEDLEAMYSTERHRNLPYRDAFQSSAFVLPLASGSGLQFPCNAPHWVKNGPEVSVSFSVTFRSSASRRRVLLYQANARLRRLGLEPKPVGVSPLRDTAMELSYRTWLRVKRAVKGGKAEAGERPGY